jgi:dTDP-4-dehydrorhamnose reductase
VLARAAARENAPILHLSTDYVFDGTLERPWREDDPVHPVSVYGASKLAGERMIAASGATFAILRTAWVYSPFGSNFVRTMLRLAESRDELNVVEDQVGSPTSAHDIAEALNAVIATWRRDAARGTNAVYHVAGSGEADWAELARAAFEESASRGGPSARVNGIPSSGYPTRARRPANSRLDCARFEGAFGYRCPAWRQSLAPVVARLLTGR